ncbi:MAG: triose-phosphate isomerase [Candidatus Portnoybacteria bacterium]|nr:triose-phosphate isomerase [Candidatus Portnoybacteria bacterium]MDD4982560.1 triose-phosphate isomerase [Candidatus Portnoybacteria bacterium]
MTKKIIIANWKMNPKKAKEAQALFEAAKEGARGVKNIQIVVCPPFVWLGILKSNVQVKLGVQNCHWENSGAFTGEISAAMAADSGAEYVILGHSERRRYMGETDEIINLKIKSALKAKLKAVLCVGEKFGEEMSIVVESQIIKSLAGLSVNQMKDVILAYEPVWAVGTGHNCSPDNALSAGLFIRKTLTKLYSRFLAEKVPVLYGGSVDDENDNAYIDQSRLDGLLVGGASLDAEEFAGIIKGIGR